MSCYKRLCCDIEKLQTQLVEISLAVEALRSLAAERGEMISKREVLLQLSGLPTSRDAVKGITFDPQGCTPSRNHSPYTKPP